MIDMDKICDEIECLEECGKTSYDVCNKLAILYTVKDHLEKKMKNMEAKAASQYNMSNTPPKAI